MDQWALQVWHVNYFNTIKYARVNILFTDQQYGFFKGQIHCSENTDKSTKILEGDSIEVIYTNF